MYLLWSLDLATAREGDDVSTIGEQKPATLALRVENVPADLAGIHAWVLWSWERRETWTKPPRMVDGRPASSTDPATWAPFEDVCAVYDRGACDGVGFVLDPTLGLVGFDLDHVIDESGTIHPEALRIVDEANSYTEKSPSGTGLRIITRGPLPPGWRNARAALAFPIECYSEGRYLTITGHHLEGTPRTIEERTAAVAGLHARVAAAIEAGNGQRPAQTPPPAESIIPDDATLLERARAARNGAKFSALWAGDTSAHGGDDSAADLALCSHLAFWTGRDAARMDRLFRQSELMRPKWGKRRGATQTYGERTIAKARQDCGELYSGADLATNGRDRPAAPASVDPPSYIEPLAVFLAEGDPPRRWIFPDLLHTDVLMLIHGEPRARKSLVGFELALSAATGTAPFGLDRFQPEAAVVVWYVQEEDARSLTRPRLRRLVHERCGADIPDTLHVSVRRGIDLDDPVWVARIIADAKRLGVRFLVLDAARRLSVKTDEGPAKVRELIAALRAIVTEAGVTIAIVHHDVKPSANGQDVRRRSQRASRGRLVRGVRVSGPRRARERGREPGLPPGL